MNRKILTTFCFCLLNLALLANNNSAQATINQADSLFDSKKYTEALFLYDSLFHIENVYSPQMLFKLSFIEEGLDEYQKALYFLNYLYFWHPSQTIVDKMDALAEKHELSGYTSSDIDVLYEFYSRYKFYFVPVLASISLLVIGLLVHQKIKHRPLNHGLLVLGILLLGALFYVANFNPFPQKAIVSKPNSLLMNDASSAAEFVETAKEGNRISILGEQDDWYLVEYGDTTAYIKKGQLDVIKIDF